MDPHQRQQSYSEQGMCRSAERFDNPVYDEVMPPRALPYQQQRQGSHSYSLLQPNQSPIYDVPRSQHVYGVPMSNAPSSQHNYNQNSRHSANSGSILTTALTSTDEDDDVTSRTANQRRAHRPRRGCNHGNKSATARGWPSSKHSSSKTTNGSSASRTDVTTRRMTSRAMRNIPNLHRKK